MAKVRLLELRNTYKWGGGPDKTILLSAECHDRNRVETIVAYVRDVSDNEFRIAEKARQRGLTFYEIEERRKLDFRVLDMLAEIILRHEINLIHAHDYKTDLFAYLLMLKLRDRRPAVISTMHGWALLGTRGRLYWWLDVWLMRHFDHLIAVSQSTKNQMVTATIPGELITVIHNGIDTEAWSRRQVKNVERDALGIATGFPVIGYVGRISPEKDLSTWLQAAARVIRHYPATQLVMVGEGRDDVLLKQLKNLASQLGIAKNLQLLGYRDDLAEIYTTFDLFFLSSSTEGICNSLLESMAMRVPVVTTDAGGTKELMVNGRTGFMLPVGDVNGLATAMLEVVKNKHLREAMGEAARKHIEANFSFFARLQRLESLYEKVVEHHNGSLKRSGSQLASCVE